MVFSYIYSPLLVKDHLTNAETLVILSLPLPKESNISVARLFFWLLDQDCLHLQRPDDQCLCIQTNSAHAITSVVHDSYQSFYKLVMVSE